MKLIAGTSNQPLAQNIAKYLKVEIVDCKFGKFSNGELIVKLNESVRDEHVFILQTGCENDGYTVSDHFQQTMLILDACLEAKSRTLLMPCFPCARQDKKDTSGVPITVRVNIRQLELYVDRTFAVDLHSGQIQAVFRRAMHNMYAFKYLVKYLKKNVFKGMSQEDMQNQFVLVSPDNGGAKRVDAYSVKLDINNIIMHKQRNHHVANKVDKMLLVGDAESLKDKTAIIIDDMIDTMGTMISAIDILVKDGGIKNVIVLATHGILSGEALNRINGCEVLSKVIVTNSLPQEENKKKCPKIEIVDLAELLGECVQRCLTPGKRLSELFKAEA